jgi:cell wall-associated NlpC family hydrolase
MRRRTITLAALALLALGSAQPASAANWALPQIQAVVARGLMAPSVAEFRPNDPLTRVELGQLVYDLTQKQQVVVNPTTPVNVRQLDARLVRVLGLGPAAAHVQSVAVNAGLRPRGRFGTEVVARLLRLRFDHPASQDALELRPADPITRAETAYSVARLLQLTSSDLQYANDTAMSFSLPALTTWQRRVLTRAVRFAGYPYVWGGMWEHTETFGGVTSRGGFDCSGFAWRVYKLVPYDGAPQLGSTILGRTTYAMSGEFPRSQRVSRWRLRPADLVFFGDNGTASTPSQVGHMGIFLGHGWFIHSSSQGVTAVPLTGWYADRFAWGRRPLREAGLS